MHLIRGTTPTLRSAPEIIAKQMQRIRAVPNLLIMSRVFEPGKVQIVAAETDDNFGVNDFLEMHATERECAKFEMGHIWIQAKQIGIEVKSAQGVETKP